MISCCFQLCFFLITRCRSPCFLSFERLHFFFPMLRHLWFRLLLLSFGAYILANSSAVFIFVCRLFDCLFVCVLSSLRSREWSESQPAESLLYVPRFLLLFLRDEDEGRRRRRRRSGEGTSGAGWRRSWHLLILFKLMIHFCSLYLLFCDVFSFL